MKKELEKFEAFQEQLRNASVESEADKIKRVQNTPDFERWIKYYFPDNNNEIFQSEFHEAYLKALDKKVSRLVTSDWRREFFCEPFPHDQNACKALKQYHEHRDLCDAIMFEQIPFRNGFVNGRRLNTHRVDYRNMEYFAAINDTTVERMKKHWRCVKE